MERRLAAFLEKRGVCGVSVLVAFSGGSDSTALLLAAAAVAPGLGIRLHAAWVDHGIRPAGERAGERDFVTGLGARLGIPCHIADAPAESLEARAARLKTSLEAEARDFRYAALLDAAARFGCGRILTAHTRDDQAETLLARILSGSGAAGLRGIPEDRPPFLRPFLTLPKRVLLRYLRDRGESWREDSTNAAEDYLRNRLRHRLIPAVEREFPGFRKALSALAEKSRLDEDCLYARAEAELPAVRTEGRSSFEVRAFRAAHPALRLRALMTEASRLAGTGRRIPYAFVRAAALAGPAQQESSGPRILARGSGLRFLEEGGEILVVRESAVSPAPSGLHGDGGAIRDVTSASGYSFLFERPGALRIDPGPSCTIYFRRDSAGPAEGSFQFPLTVRSRLPGDRIAIRGGRKPLDEILTDLKVPRTWRDFVPVLEDGRGIVGVLGSAAGVRDRFRTGSDAPDSDVPRLAVELEGIGPFRSIERSAEAP